jgi:copper homeostasis protein
MTATSRPLILEACVETIQQGLLAEKNHADRIEFCQRLDLGGITPDHDLIRTAINKIKIPVKIMIRPRGGDFIYSNSEIDRMKSDIKYCKSIGVEEVVLGALNNDGEVDYSLTQHLAKLAIPMKVTFHKAIDEVSNYMNALKTLSSIQNIGSVLTSGTKENALAGKDYIKIASEEFSETLNIIAAGSITNTNLKKIHSELNMKEYHGKKIVGDLILKEYNKRR